MKEGDNVVLGIDMNKDAHSGKLAKCLSSLGVRDLIHLTHSSSSPPATFNRNASRTPVDAIWGSCVIDVVCASYGHFDAEAPST